MRRAEIDDRKRNGGNDEGAAEQGAASDEADDESEREMLVPQHAEIDQRAAVLRADLPGDEQRQRDHGRRSRDARSSPPRTSLAPACGARDRKPNHDNRNLRSLLIGA
jgi:hypothetical protein